LKANASASKLRAAQGQLHLLPEFAAEMVNLGVNLIAAIERLR
jgi:hypothetical protein